MGFRDKCFHGVHFVRPCSECEQVTEAKEAALAFVKDQPREIWETIVHIAQKSKMNPNDARVRVQSMIQNDVLDVNKDMLLVEGDGTGLWP